MKYWAYKTQHCNHIVLAADIESDKIARNLKGRWTSPPFYSEGEPGRRDVMFQRTNRGGNGGHFYYQSEDAEREGGGGRETLSHALCKRAISELTETKLRVGNVEIPIRILESSTEKELDINGSRYRPDVSLRFESDGEHQLKWAGALHVEVWHTHPTQEAKWLDFFQAGLALFEMRVTEKLQFDTAEHSATSAAMEQHVQWLKRLFSGWIGGKLLSDPKSREYLLLENTNLVHSLDHISRKKTSTERALAQVKADCAQLQEHLADERQQRAIHQAESSKLTEQALHLEQELKAAHTSRSQLADVHAEMGQQSSKLKEQALHWDQALKAAHTARSQLAGVHAEAAKSLRLWRCIGMTALLAFLAVLLLWLWP